MNKNIRIISKSTIITLIALYASSIPSNATKNLDFINEQEGESTEHTYKSFFNDLFESDEFQDLLDGPSTVVALRHLRASFSAMTYGIYDYLRTGNLSYFTFWNPLIDPAPVHGREASST